MRYWTVASYYKELIVDAISMTTCLPSENMSLTIHCALLIEKRPVG